MQRFSVAMMAGVALVLMMASCSGERDLFVTLDPDAPTTQAPDVLLLERAGQSHKIVSVEKDPHLSAP